MYKVIQLNISQQSLFHFSQLFENPNSLKMQYDDYMQTKAEFFFSVIMHILFKMKDISVDPLKRRVKIVSWRLYNVEKNKCMLHVSYYKRNGVLQRFP